MLASANVLAKAVNSIQEVELTKCSLTIYQVPIRNNYFQQEKQRLIEPKRCNSNGLSNLITQGIYLFSVMAESTILQKLSLDGNDLSMVPPEHVAKGTNRLQEVRLGHLSLSLFCLFVSLSVFFSSFFVYPCLSLLVRVLVCHFCLCVCLSVWLCHVCLPMALGLLWLQVFVCAWTMDMGNNMVARGGELLCLCVCLTVLVSVYACLCLS